LGFSQNIVWLKPSFFIGIPAPSAKADGNEKKDF
jgi:hypothetical protein